MYIDSLVLTDFRSFKNVTVRFLHPDRRFEAAALRMPRPRLPNLNLVLGNNGLGKTALLRALGLALLGPAAQHAGIFPYCLVRREPENSAAENALRSTLRARFTLHAQDGARAGQNAGSKILVQRMGDLESLTGSARRVSPSDPANKQELLSPTETWKPIFSESSDAFFFVGYGANRRVERTERIDLGARRAAAFARALRIQSLFEDSFSLIPLSIWLPAMPPERTAEVISLVNRLLGEGQYQMTGELEAGEYLFAREGLRLPFPALSDGYRAFLAWIGDLLYHLCQTCPPEKKLVDQRGVVLLDEIDLHLHPSWQMTLLATIASVLPNLQFIATSHSPLLVGTLEWMNVLVMEQGPNQTCEPRRIQAPVHGLDADQVLLSDYFGLDSTRSDSKRQELRELTSKATRGDSEAALELLQALSRGQQDPAMARQLFEAAADLVESKS